MMSNVFRKHLHVVWLWLLTIGLTISLHIGFKERDRRIAEIRREQSSRIANVCNIQKEIETIVVNYFSGLSKSNQNVYSPDINILTEPTKTFIAQTRAAQKKYVEEQLKLAEVKFKEINC